LKRPPRNKIEAIKTLQEAEQRYKEKEKFLIGKTRKSINDEKINENKDRTNYLENVPKGINFARLSYPPNNSEIILCGVKRRAMLHSSFVSDLLTEMQPECTFVQLAPDNPMFIKP